MGSSPSSIQSPGIASPQGESFSQNDLLKFISTPKRKVSRAPSPSILYNGASGARGFSLPSEMIPDTLADFNLLSPFNLISLCINVLPIYLVSLTSYLTNLIIITISYLYLLILSLYHHHLGHTLNSNHPISLQSISEFCSSHRIPKIFVEGLLISLFSAVMTAQADSVKDAPAAEILAYIAATFGEDHCTVETGVDNVENALVERLTKKGSDHGIHTNCKVVGILPGEIKGQVSLRVVKEEDEEDLQAGSDDSQEPMESNSQESQFDGFSHVIFATQANQTAKFLEYYSNALRTQSSSSTSIINEKEIRRLSTISRKLKSFKYETSVVTNHTDRSLLPPDEKDWRDLNLVSPVFEAQVNSFNLSDLNAKGSLSRLNTKFSTSNRPSEISPRFSNIKQDFVSTPLSSSEDSSLGWSYSTGVTSENEDEELPDLTRNRNNDGKSLLVGKHEEVDGTDLSEMIRKLDSISDPLRDGNHTMATHIIQRRVYPNYSSSEVRNQIENCPKASRRGSTSKLVEAHDGPLLMQTTNALPGLGPRPEFVLSVSKFDRVVLSREGKMSQTGLFDFVKVEKRSFGTISSVFEGRSKDWKMEVGHLQGKGINEIEEERDRPGIWVCGSWGPGIPLLEGESN